MGMTPTGRWALVCNPAKWEIDKFIRARLPHAGDDTWGVRPSDARGFRAGDYAVIRVGADRRSQARLGGFPKLSAGIYALCEITSAAFPGEGAADEFWIAEEVRSSAWPTVKIRYLQNYLEKPLLLSQVRKETPSFNPHILNGLQCSSFPIPVSDFDFLIERLEGAKSLVMGSTSATGGDWMALAEEEAAMLHMSPSKQKIVSVRYERGQVGKHVKRANGYRCQVCEKLGLPTLGFKRANGQPYIEAHHVVPISTQNIGSGAYANVISVCANHHRQLHYGGIQVEFAPKSFHFTFPEGRIEVPRFDVKKGAPHAA